MLVERHSSSFIRSSLSASSSFLDHPVARWLPTTPASSGQWPWWPVIFGLPHILGSFITLADRDYLKYYNKPLFLPLAAILFVTITFPIYVPMDTTILLIGMAIWTSYHILSQQYGIALALLRKRPTFYFYVWKYLSIGFTTGILSNVFGGLLLNQNFVFDISLTEWMRYLSIPGLTGATAASYMFFRTFDGNETKIARQYYILNVCMMLVAFPSTLID